MAVVTICSDFGAQENKVSHCFHVSGHEFEQTLGDGERQEAWHTAARGVTEPDMTERLNHPQLRMGSVRLRPQRPPALEPSSVLHCLWTFITQHPLVYIRSFLLSFL